MRRRIRRMLLGLIGNRAFQSNKLNRILGFEDIAGLTIDSIGILKLEYDRTTEIGKRLFLGGTFEQDEVRLGQSIISSIANPIIFDVGANIGWHTLYWAKNHQNVTIFAFEPAPQTRQLLSKNIYTNKLKHKVNVFPYALSNRVGEAKFYENQDNAFSSLKDTQRKKVVNIRVVPVTTIDHFIEEQFLEQVHLVKIDVEGLETSVIEGATSTLANIQPDLLVEIYGGVASNPDPEYTIDLICSFGYHAFVMSGNITRPYQKHNDGQYQYYFTKRKVGFDQ